MEPDELLIKSALNGNQDAFRKIVEKYQTFVFAICLNITRDRQEAENMAQETFLQVYRSLSSYQLKGFKTWVGRIATNKALDWKRKNKLESTRKVVFLDDVADLNGLEEESNHSNHSHHNDHSDHLVEKEKKEKIISLCNNLPEKYSIVLKKYYFQSKSYQQISTEEGISVKTVESRLYRAKKSIREKWEEEEEPYEAF